MNILCISKTNNISSSYKGIVKILHMVGHATFSFLMLTQFHLIYPPPDDKVDPPVIRYKQNILYSGENNLTEY